MNRLIVQVSIAAIAIHVVDDRFLQPQPGTSATDHLASGLIPLALLALAAWAYPRLRAGRRGALALGLALVAALSGAEAIYYWGHTGLAGDDYTGLLALVTAPLLLAVGGRELWSSRRLDDGHALRYARRLLVGLAALALASTVVLPMALAYVAAHVARADVPDARLDGPHEDVRLLTSDGLELRGWYVPSRNRAAVIVFPGRSGTQRQARMLARHGYGVLLYDRRGEGQSEGDPDGWGWDFDKDIKAGIEFLRDRPDVDPHPIGGLGLSVGGEMMLQTAAETKQLDAVVAEGAGARTAGEEVDDASGIGKLTTALAYGARDIANSILQDRLPPDNLIDIVPRIAPTPVFFIHAGEDDVGRRGPAYYRAAGEPKQIWEAKGGHTEGIEKDPHEYERRVIAFFDGALRP